MLKRKTLLRFYHTTKQRPKAWLFDVTKMNTELFTRAMQ